VHVLASGEGVVVQVSQRCRLATAPQLNIPSHRPHDVCDCSYMSPKEVLAATMKSIDPHVLANFHAIVAQQKGVADARLRLGEQRERVNKLTADMTRLERDKAHVEEYQALQRRVRIRCHALSTGRCCGPRCSPHRCLSPPPSGHAPPPPPHPTGCPAEPTAGVATAVGGVAGAASGGEGRRECGGVARGAVVAAEGGEGATSAAGGDQAGSQAHRCRVDSRRTSSGRRGQ